MNKEQTKQAIAVMQGYVEGKTIQYSPHDNGAWSTLTWCPGWEWNNNNYRIKPEVAKYRRYLWNDLGRPSVDVLFRSVADCAGRAADLLAIENSQYFIRWIDTEWQELEV